MATRGQSAARSCRWMCGGWRWSPLWTVRRVDLMVLVGGLRPVSHQPGDKLVEVVALASAAAAWADSRPVNAPAAAWVSLIRCLRGQPTCRRQEGAGPPGSQICEERCGSPEEECSDFCLLFFFRGRRGTMLKRRFVALLKRKSIHCFFFLGRRTMNDDGETSELLQWWCEELTQPTPMTLLKFPSFLNCTCSKATTTFCIHCLVVFLFISSLYFASFPQKKKAQKSKQVGDDSRDPLAEPQWVFPQSIDSVKSIKKKAKQKKPSWLVQSQTRKHQTNFDSSCYELKNKTKWK